MSKAFAGHPCCYRCTLPLSHCCCLSIALAPSSLRWTLLTHPREYLRLDNTGRLAKVVLRSGCQRMRWQRQMPPLQLPQPSYLIFPNETGQPPLTLEQIPSPAGVNLIVLDATWQEARKMLRQSTWLQRLPRLQLMPEQLSQFRLRRHQQAGHLCTIEAMALAHSQWFEPMHSTALLKQLDRFQHHYQAWQSGHPPVNNADAS